MAIKRIYETVKLSSFLDENWEDSYIKLKPFTVRESQEFAEKHKNLEKLAGDNENKAIDTMVDVIKSRFVEAKIWDEELKQCVDTEWAVIEKELLTVKVMVSLIKVMSGEGKA